MSRIFVTGSTQGVGAEAARQLIEQDHEVVVHARDATRTEAALKANPQAAAVVTGEFDSIDSTKECALAVRHLGPFDAVIHNAAASPHQDQRIETRDGLENIFHVNVVSPYILACLMPLAPRMVFVGSDAGQVGRENFEDLQWTARDWDGTQAYADSKLYVAMIAMELAHRHPDVITNVVHPGWVRTSMGGPTALLPIEEGADSPVWLATSDEPVARTSGQFIHLRAVETINPQALDHGLRAELLRRLEEITGLSLP